MRRLPPAAFLPVEVVSELQTVAQVTGGTHEEVNRIGSHMVSDGKPAKPHAADRRCVVVPDRWNPGFPPAQVGIRILDPEIEEIF